jgi:hypothetical protein
MSPYVTFALAMCAIVFLALAGTAYMAVYFNRRAKADLQAALAPLADVIAGEIDLDEASVTGRYRGQIAQGLVATLPGGMGRVPHLTDRWRRWRTLAVDIDTIERARRGTEGRGGEHPRRTDPGTRADANAAAE